eukprot:TRINITY_DN22908_c0_g1_i1.p1 TRINITY_DN22908_c0_g1~~TRINITY_DN22908_c0_g1_i1.p1  ORF type:complete len:273 (+),score=80.84 TRINITY_DN22908_c0_g1_i1:71-889(+)
MLRGLCFAVAACSGQAEVIKGAWMAPGGVGNVPGDYDMVSHFAGEPAWYRAKYHGEGMHEIPPYAGPASAKYKMFTVCGDSCVFTKDFMEGTYLRNADLSPVTWGEMTGELQAKGYNGVIFDFELFNFEWSAADNAALNGAFAKIKAAGMYSAWTTAAMGPYQNASATAAPIDIDWTALDFVLPEMYDAHQNYLGNGLPTYAKWWAQGGLSLHNYRLATPVDPAHTQVVWGASTQAAGVGSGIGIDTYTAAYAATNLPGGFMEWVYSCAYPC